MKKNGKKKIMIIALVVIVIIGMFAMSGGSDSEESSSTDVDAYKLNEKVVNVCKSQTPFVDEEITAGEYTIGDIFDSYFGDYGVWNTQKDIMPEVIFDEANAVYIGTIATADLQVNSEVVAFCEEKGVDLSQSSISIIFAFSVDGDSVEYPYVIVGDPYEEDRVAIMDNSGAKSMLFTMYALVDSGLSLEKSMGIY